MAELTAAQIQEMLDSFYPYKKRFVTHRDIPARPLSRDEVLAQIETMSTEEDALGDTGKVSGSLYLGDHEQYAFLTEVFEKFAHANVLQRDMYPSSTKFEGEIVAMTAAMLGGDEQTVAAWPPGASPRRRSSSRTRPTSRSTRPATTSGSRCCGLRCATTSSSTSTGYASTSRRTRSPSSARPAPTRTG